MYFFILLHFFVFLVFLYLIGFILRKNPRALVNWVCALIIFCFAIWSFGMIPFSDVNSSTDTARLGTKISSIGWASLPAFVLFFFIFLAKKFTEKEGRLKKNIAYFVIFIPAIFFIYKQWRGLLIFDFTKQYYGWSYSWSESIWTYFFYAYNYLFLIIAHYLCFDFMRKTEILREKRQMKIMFIAGVTTVILGTVSNVLLQKFNIHSLPDLANVFGLIWMGGLVYAVTRYGLMTVTVEVAADGILKTMGDSLIITEPGSKIIIVNQATLDLLGYKERDLIGSPITTIFDKDEYPHRLNELMQKLSIKDYDAAYRSRSGAEIPISLFMSLLKNREGELVGIVCIAKDMRQIKYLMQKEKELAQAVIESEKRRVAGLERAYEELRNTQAQLIQSAKMAAVGQLGAGVAHELNNPLVGILGFAQFMLEKFRKTELNIEDFQGFQKYIESIEREAGRCKDIVENLLKFSRRPAEVKLVPMDIAGALEETLSIIDYQLKLNNVNLIMDIKPGLAQVMGISNQLQQVFTNLILNAQQAMPEGGALKISAQNILDEKTKTPLKVKIEFQDTGCGIPPENLPHIFEPFFTTKHKEKGTGLGLTISYQIIQDHKGAMEVTSEAGIGTTMGITLPAIN